MCMHVSHLILLKSLPVNLFIYQIILSQISFDILNNVSIWKNLFDAPHNYMQQEPDIIIIYGIKHNTWINEHLYQTFFIFKYLLFILEKAFSIFVSVFLKYKVLLLFLQSSNVKQQSGILFCSNITWYLILLPLLTSVTNNHCFSLISLIPIFKKFHMCV